jgi:hypothetical protein
MHDGAASRAALSKRPSLKHEPRTEVQTSQAEQVRNSKSFRRAGKVHVLSVIVLPRPWTLASRV